VRIPSFREGKKGEGKILRKSEHEEKERKKKCFLREPGGGPTMTSPEGGKKGPAIPPPGRTWVKKKPGAT